MTRRVYTAEDARRWARAMTEGLDGPAFQTRFGLPLKQARDCARTHGVEIPHVERGRLRDAKAPEGDRSVQWFPTPRSRRKPGATRRRMT